MSPTEKNVVGPEDVVIKARHLTYLRVAIPVLVTLVGGLATVALDARSKIDDAIRDSATAKEELARHVDAADKRFEKLENAYSRDNREIRDVLSNINSRLSAIDAKLELIAPRRGPRQH